MKEAQDEEQDEEQEIEIDLIRKKTQDPEEVSQSWSEQNTGQSRGVSKLVRVEKWTEHWMWIPRGGKVSIEMFGVQSKCLC